VVAGVAEVAPVIFDAVATVLVLVLVVALVRACERTQRWGRR
jgi:hypothetical protein